MDFKVLLLVYESPNGLGPEYIYDMFKEYEQSRALRFMGSGQQAESKLNMVRQHLAGTNC